MISKSVFLPFVTRRFFTNVQNSFNDIKEIKKVIRSKRVKIYQLIRIRNNEYNLSNSLQIYGMHVLQEIWKKQKNYEMIDQ